MKTANPVKLSRPCIGAIVLRVLLVLLVLQPPKKPRHALLFECRTRRPIASYCSFYVSYSSYTSRKNRVKSSYIKKSYG